LVAVLTAIDILSPKRILCLGDTAGYYSQINECCDLLRARRIFSLRGNHDDYLAMGSDCPRSTSANRCLDYQRKVISSENLEWLKSLKPCGTLEGLDIAHGGWNDPLDEYVVPSEEYFEGREGNFFASGHSHVACVWRGSSKSYCNPGSVGQPRDGNWRAGYATWDGLSFELHRVDYDLEATCLGMVKSGFDSYYYENLKSGARIGGRIDSLETLRK
jgi:diadenosine tetraphosphatase ApaH/serine/threonine PP2A family protein phosphatase